MKKGCLVLPVALLLANTVFAQDHNTLWCNNPKLKTTHNVQALKSEKGSWNMQVSWGGPSGGSTFGPKNLSITNGSCQSCKPLGAIGAKHPKEVWKIKVTDPSKPVVFAWASEGTVKMCGTGKLSLRQ
ncbi:MAG: hypothetical protein R3E87_24400 [Burkholderiaceae bacterium]